MRERPIIFSAPMVRAILAGTKTQTRRVACEGTIPSQYVRAVQYEPGRWRLFEAEDPQAALGQYTMPRCPYGAPGEKLWVREAHWWFVDEPDPTCGYFPPLLTRDDVEYRADDETKWRPWRSSIHMPRWASRITLEITEVRVERLQDISEADAAAEGVERVDTCWIGAVSGRAYGNARDAFQDIWSDINGLGSWDANPWVWVLTFRRVEAA